MRKGHPRMPACSGLQNRLLRSIGFAEAPEGQGFPWGLWNRRPNPQPASKLESEKHPQREGGPRLHAGGFLPERGTSGKTKTEEMVVKVGVKIVRRGVPWKGLCPGGGREAR